MIYPKTAQFTVNITSRSAMVKPATNPIMKE